jgi:hypothetical protein
VEPEAFERRLMLLLIKSKRNLIRRCEREGTPEGRRRMGELLDEILRVDPDS